MRRWLHIGFYGFIGLAGFLGLAFAQMGSFGGGDGFPPPGGGGGIGGGGDVPSMYPLTVSKDGSGAGTVSGGNGVINCGFICTGQFNEGSSVTLTAIAENGSQFTKWQGACTGVDAECTVAMVEAQKVTAVFDIKRNDSSGGGGEYYFGSEVEEFIATVKKKAKRLPRQDLEEIKRAKDLPYNVAQLKIPRCKLNTINSEFVAQCAVIRPGSYIQTTINLYTGATESADATRGWRVAFEENQNGIFQSTLFNIKGGIYQTGTVIDKEGEVAVDMLLEKEMVFATMPDLQTSLLIVPAGMFPDAPSIRWTDLRVTIESAPLIPTEKILELLEAIAPRAQAAPSVLPVGLIGKRLRLGKAINARLFAIEELFGNIVDINSLSDSEFMALENAVNEYEALQNQQITLTGHSIKKGGLGLARIMHGLFFSYAPEVEEVAKTNAIDGRVAAVLLGALSPLDENRFDYYSITEGKKVKIRGGTCMAVPDKKGLASIRCFPKIVTGTTAQVEMTAQAHLIHARKKMYEKALNEAQRKLKDIEMALFGMPE